MATIGGKLTPDRMPSHKGRIIVDTWRGKIRIRSWPKKATRPLPPAVVEQMEWFRQANKLAKYAPAEDQIWARTYTAGTPLMPRDLFVAAIAGRLFGEIVIDGERFYSMAARRDITEMLDILAQAEGSILYRSADWWEALPPGEPGQVLTSQGPGLPPVWVTPEGAPEPEPEPTAPTASYWRLHITKQGSCSQCRVVEMEYRATPGGADQATGGTATASGYYTAGYEPAKAFDDDGATYWRHSALPMWLQYEWPSPVTVEEVAITISATCTEPVDFTIEKSDDGITWETVVTRTGEAWTAAGQTKLFATV